MKQTRRYSIEKKVFTLEDLRRISTIFERQGQLAKKSDHHHGLTYNLHFADNTSFEADSAAILEDGSIVDTKRPVKVEFSFHNYSLDRSLAFSLTHGISDYGNGIVVRGPELDWVNDNFTRLKDAIDAAKPQECWLANRPAIPMNLFAVGIGSLGMLLIDIFISLIMPDVPLTVSPETHAKMQALRGFILSHRAWFYFLGWFWRWFVGYAWGAIPLTNWFLRAWPNIELDFGADHLKQEKSRRKRILAVLSLVIVPILVTLAVDLIKRVM